MIEANCATVRKTNGHDSDHHAWNIRPIGPIALFSSAIAADNLTMSSTNPTALELDQLVAREKGFFAQGKSRSRVQPT